MLYCLSSILVDQFQSLSHCIYIVFVIHFTLRVEEVLIFVHYLRINFDHLQGILYLYDNRSEFAYYQELVI